MKTRLIMPCLLGLALLSGCAGAGMPPASALLAGAHSSLQEDDLRTAGVWLGSAESRVESEQDRKEYALLSAEVSLRSGEADLALEETDALLAAHPDDPRVHEMAGKAQLLTGGFEAAGAHFDFAADRYESEPDILRATDLFELSRGLAVYAEGNLAAANEHWRAIQDPALLDSVRDAAAGLAPDDDASLARSNQPVR